MCDKLLKKLTNIQEEEKGQPAELKEKIEKIIKLWNQFECYENFDGMKKIFDNTSKFFEAYKKFTFDDLKIKVLDEPVLDEKKIENYLNIFKNYYESWTEKLKDLKDLVS